jgi:hypothetical protein
MTALSNEIEPESDDQQEVKRLKLENASLKEKLYYVIEVWPTHGDQVSM